MFDEKKSPGMCSCSDMNSKITNFNLTFQIFI